MTPIGMTILVVIQTLQYTIAFLAVRGARVSPRCFRNEMKVDIAVMQPSAAFDKSHHLVTGVVAQ